MTDESIVEKRWRYYAPRFERFARGSWLSWNWAAFFGTLAWLRYRKLYAWSWFYFFVSAPVVAALVLVVAAGDSCERALDPGPTNALGLIALALIALGFIVPPLVANRLYYNHVRRMAEKGEGASTGTGGVAGALALQAFLVLGVAIVTPSMAYYIYRSMVSEGVSLAAAAKSPVSEYFMNHKRMPARLEDVEASTSGRFVERVVIESDGTIRSIFGKGGKKLAGRSVMVVPRIKDGAIDQWTCRSADLPKQCLPGACRD